MLDVISAVDPRGVALNYCMKEGNFCERSCDCKINSKLADLQQTVVDKLQAVTFDTLI